jgi:hypothetical protein
MHERRVNPTESFEVRRLFSRAFPLFIVPIMALLAVFRSNEDLFNFCHPVGLSLCLLRNGKTMIQADAPYKKQEEETCGNVLRIPAAS